MPENFGNRGLFCDLAGTLIKFDEQGELPLEPNGRIKIELLPGVAETLAPIHDHLIFVVTNQAAVSRGHVSVEQIETALSELDSRLGGILTAWQICPHSPESGCNCRKPATGMITELAATYGVDLPLSTMVGDQVVDEQCAQAAGIGRFVYSHEFFGGE